jgi:dolichol-phosphate mannosyltransferase
MPNAKRSLISLVVPCYNEEDAFPHLERELTKLADQLDAEFDVEVVLVDDGSRDRTWAAISRCAARDARFRGVALSRNFGHQLALTCGYDLARGDAILCMDADLQDPPEVVQKMVEAWRSGADIVLAVRTERQGETRVKLWTAILFYRMISALSATHIRPNSGDFRLMSRKALDALNSLREQHRFVRGMVGWLGFETAEVLYERQPRVAGETKYPFRKMFRLAVDAMVSFSSFPLRITFLFALGLSFIVFAYLAFVAISIAFGGAELVPGWTSLILAITLFGAANLICLGIMGEYIGRTYEQSKGRPLYFIRAMTTDRSPSSTVVADMHRSTRAQQPPSRPAGGADGKSGLPS